MVSYTKEPSFCRSEILFVGTTGLKTIPDHPEVPVELYIDVLAPERYTSVFFKEVSLYIEILTEGVKMVPHPLHNPSGEWSLWDGNQWVVTPTSTHPSTSFLRLRNFNIRVTSGGTNGKSHRAGITGLTSGGLLEMRAYCDAVNAVADTKSCAIRMKDFQVGQQLSGFLD